MVQTEVTDRHRGRGDSYRVLSDEKFMGQFLDRVRRMEYAVKLGQFKSDDELRTMFLSDLIGLAGYCALMYAKMELEQETL